MTKWWAYVRKVARRHSAHEIARRAGLSASSVIRWKSSEPKPETVRAFAVAYGRPVQEAFIAAGFLHPEDLRMAQVDEDGPLTVEEAIERIWALDALPEKTRELLILELLKGTSARHASQGA